jgi:hypothetical protein
MRSRTHHTLTTAIKVFSTAQIGVSVTVVRSTLEIAGFTFSCLLIAVGGGLTSDPMVLMTAAAGLFLSLMLAALVARWWKPARVPAA